uniref:RING-type domain-containing protein n=1 Tax=Auxenochlorella protothecoides TaxID=3075 RepID=A0A1D2ACM3_AUXPR
MQTVYCHTEHRQFTVPEGWDGVCPSCGGGFVELQGAAPLPVSSVLVDPGLHMPTPVELPARPSADWIALLSPAQVPTRPRPGPRPASFQLPGGHGVVHFISSPMDAPPGFPVFEVHGQGGSLRDMLMEALVQSGIMTQEGGAGVFPGSESMDDIMTRIMDDYQPVSHPTARRAREAFPRLRVRPAGQKDPGEGEAAAAAGEPCSICHETYSPGDEVVELPCDHCFHPDCVMPWLETHNTCPVCRLELPAEEGGPAAGEAAPQPSAGRGARASGGMAQGPVAFHFPASQAGTLAARVTQALGELVRQREAQALHRPARGVVDGVGPSAAGPAQPGGRSDAGSGGGAPRVDDGGPARPGTRVQDPGALQGAARTALGGPGPSPAPLRGPPSVPADRLEPGAAGAAAGQARGRSTTAAAGPSSTPAEQPLSAMAMVAGALVAALAGTALGALLGSSRRSQR